MLEIVIKVIKIIKIATLIYLFKFKPFTIIILSSSHTYHVKKQEQHCERVNWQKKRCSVSIEEGEFAIK